MQSIRNFARLIVDRRVPLFSKLAFVGLVGGYILFPADILPDILPLVGIADDGALLLTAVTLFSRYANARINDAEKEDTDKEETMR